MNDFMDDFTAPRKTPETPPVSGAAREQVFTAADVYEAGRLTPVREESVLAEILKGILGAVVGAIPGVLLWIIIGRVGFIAAICGAVLAGGTVAGYIFMSKDNFLPQHYGVIICLAVIIISVYISQKVVWCWELSDIFQKEFSYRVLQTIPYVFDQTEHGLQLKLFLLYQLYLQLYAREIHKYRGDIHSHLY